MIDPVKFGQAVAVRMREAIAGLRQEIEPRVKALEDRPVPVLPVAVKGDKGDRGEDGKSVTVEDVRGLLEAEVAKHVLDLERRAQGVLERAVDRIPKPADGKNGRDGIDGIGFEDLTVEHDGERGFTLRFARGDQVKEFAFSVPVVIDRGFWKEGAAVSKGDGMTFGGSYWIAQKDTTTKPETGNADWRLAVKKGRDAK